MEACVLFVIALLNVWLAFATCEKLARVLTPANTPMVLRGGVIGSLGAMALWKWTNLMQWDWSPARVGMALHAATSFELGIVAMLVVAWVILPGFVVGLFVQRVWSAVCRMCHMLRLR
jgi:hypothetical protein